jgi:hypothetical protein
MKSRTYWLVGAATVWCLAVTAALADGAKAQGDDPAAACAREVKGMKGEERQKGLEACLKSHGVTHGNGNGHSQQNRMKTCNVEAGKKDLHGDERRAFMSTCLKNK